MPTLVVEDGTGLSTANSYATVEEADDYFSSHPFYADNWDDLGIPEKERFLIMASAMLDGLIVWRGTVGSLTQALGWPRSGVLDNELRALSATAVPLPVKTATFELAIYLSKGDPLAASSSAGLDSLKIDVIELQFNTSTAKAPIPAAALLALRGLGEYTLGSRVRRVMVG